MDAGQTAPVSLRPSRAPLDGTAIALLASSHPALAAAGDTAAALDLARQLGRSIASAGQVETVALWEMLATIAATDIECARVVEPHLDALAILTEAQAGGIRVDLADVNASEDSTWGVFAAESSGMRLEATGAGAGAGTGMQPVTLSGTKPWCSLASRLSHALVTAHTPAGRALFAVDLRSSHITTHDRLWVARGMSGVPSGPVDFDRVHAVPVGGVGWYLDRPGFSRGGLGVAVIWWGGAIGIVRAMLEYAASREPDPFALAHLGAVDVAIEATRATLCSAAARLDAHPIGRPGSSGDQDDQQDQHVVTDTDGRLLAARGRAVAARCAETALDRSARSLGPGPLANDERFARRHADLAMYVRQHHADRDDAAIGRMITAQAKPPW